MSLASFIIFIILLSLITCTIFYETDSDVIIEDFFTRLNNQVVQSYSSVMDIGTTPEEEEKYERLGLEIKEQLDKQDIIWKYGDIKMVYRDEWGAKKPKFTMPFTEAITVFTHCFANTDPCYTKEECIKVVRKLQKNHFKQGLPDVQYNFLIGGDGNVYEGAGWFNKVIDIADAHDESHLGPRIIMGYLGRLNDVSDDERREMEKIGHDLPNWGIDHNLVMGGPLWHRTEDTINPYDAGYIYENLLKPSRGIDEFDMSNDELDFIEYTV